MAVDEVDTPLILVEEVKEAAEEGEVGRERKPLRVEGAVQVKLSWAEIAGARRVAISGQARLRLAGMGSDGPLSEAELARLLAEKGVTDLKEGEGVVLAEYDPAEFVQMVIDQSRYSTVVQQAARSGDLSRFTRMEIESFTELEEFARAIGARPRYPTSDSRDVVVLPEEGEVAVRVLTAAEKAFLVAARAWQSYQRDYQVKSKTSFGRRMNKLRPKVVVWGADGEGGKVPFEARRAHGRILSRPGGAGMVDDGEPQDNGVGAIRR